jgi:hypothetical protein
VAGTSEALAVDMFDMFDGDGDCNVGEDRLTRTHPLVGVRVREAQKKGKSLSNSPG